MKLYEIFYFNLGGSDLHEARNFLDDEMAREFALEQERLRKDTFVEVRETFTERLIHTNVKHKET